MESYSFDCAASRASETLQSEIVRVEKAKRAENMEAVDMFTPSEASIQEIVRSEIPNDRDNRKVSITSSKDRTGGRSNGKQQ